MSNDPNEFHVTGVWEICVSRDMNPESDEFELVSVSPANGKIEFTAAELLDLDRYIKQNGTPFSREAKIESELEVDTAVSDVLFAKKKLDQMLVREPLKYWYYTSSRGDHWEHIEATDQARAAEEQARRWSELGYRGPFTIFVSLSLLDAPPKRGDRVFVYRVEPQTSFVTSRLDFIKLGG